MFTNAQHTQMFNGLCSETLCVFVFLLILHMLRKCYINKQLKVQFKEWNSDWRPNPEGLWYLCHSKCAFLLICPSWFTHPQPSNMKWCNSKCICYVMYNIWSRGNEMCVFNSPQRCDFLFSSIRFLVYFHY